MKLRYLNSVKILTTGLLCFQLALAADDPTCLARAMRALSQGPQEVRLEAVRVQAALDTLSAKYSSTKNNVRRSARAISDEALEDYVEQVGKGTVEVLHIPATENHTGHLAFRVGEFVYHIQPGRGVIKEKFTQVVRIRYKDYRLDGSILETSPRQMEDLRNHFEAKIKENTSFGLLFNNCSENVCRALQAAEVVDIPRWLTIDPSISAILIGRASPTIARTHFNFEKTEPLAKALILKTVNRGFILSIPTMMVMPVMGLIWGTKFLIEDQKKENLLNAKLEDLSDPQDLANALVLGSQRALVNDKNFRASVQSLLSHLQLKQNAYFSATLSMVGIPSNIVNDAESFDKYAQDYSNEVSEVVAALIVESIRTGKVKVTPQTSVSNVPALAIEALR